MRLKSALFFTVPLEFKISTGASFRSSHHVIAIERDGVSGFGEGFGNPYRAMMALGAQAGHILCEARDYGLEELREAVSSGRLRPPMCLELALLDLLSREAGAGVSELMGGPARREVRAFHVIPIRRKEEMVREAVRLASRGWGLKLKIGRGARQDLELVKAVRKAVGPGTPIAVDANQAYPPRTAVNLFRRMERYDVRLVEQPCFKKDLAGLAAVRRALDTALMLDESVSNVVELHRAVEHGAIDVLNLKICRLGGFFKALDVLQACADNGVGIYVGTGRELGIGAAALLHISSIVPNGLFYGCEIGWWHFLGFNIVREPLGPVGGVVEVPRGPGLGITLLEPERIRELVRSRGGRPIDTAPHLLGLRSTAYTALQRATSLLHALNRPYYLARELSEALRRPLAFI